MTLDSKLATIALAILADQRKPPGDGSQRPETRLIQACQKILSTDAEGRDADIELFEATERALVGKGPPNVDQRIYRLSEQLNLTLVERLTTALALEVETSFEAGRAVAWLQEPIGGSRLLTGLVGSQLSPHASDGQSALDEIATGVALASGLLQFADEKGPLAERSLIIPDHLALALRGLDGSKPGCQIGSGSELVIPTQESLASLATRHAKSLTGLGQRTLVVRSGSVLEAKAVATKIAETLEKRPLFLSNQDTSDIGPWCLISDLLPVFVCTLGPSDRWVVPALAHYDGPVLVLTGPDGSVEDTRGTTYAWSLPVPSPAERSKLWAQALGSEDELSETLARNHRHRPGRIAELGRLARHRAKLEKRKAPTDDDVVQVAVSSDASGLDALAQPLRARVPDEALVVPEILREQLELVEARCRHRDGLTDQLGVSASTRYQPGVRVLFVGPSGTGKTLAAGWLATQLGLPLYRVDLASVVSKYIGETEKNLAQLLARAESAEVVLLFDEADSLFGKRTEVKQSTDRFANAQTNYLLQRIETYEGIVILTSNSRNRFDPAFTRRLDLVLEFATPSPQDRRGLWIAHLGTEHALSPRQINELSATVDLVGGHIRNVVLTAAVLAKEDRRKLDWQDILHGVNVEYRKMGKPAPSAFRVRRGK